ncbi:MAG: Uma2 family endonuclease [Cyanobacteria bacterium RM1_2_2]|nr:Uma2 family endonuclease [Cyanobacteria bacterium RM1_2_2]
MHVTITSDKIELPPGGEIVLRHQTWADYEALLASRSNRAAIKLYFDATTQEIRIMSPLPGHGNRSDSLADLVKILLRSQQQDWHSFDPITLKQFGQAGLEPDACFYIQNRTAILGKEQIDLTVDPPPDLALEIDQTSSTKPSDYVPIAVPELWIYRRKTLHIYLFDSQQYQESSESPLFPGLPVRQLIPQFVERAWEAGSSVALREFEQVLQPFF